MNKCNLHTVLRLPTGIFYAEGVKTNVLFFTRGTTDVDNTHEVWFYDLRTNMPSFGVTNPLRREHFADFERAFEADDRRAVNDKRFNVFTREQIAEKKNSLDLGLIHDDSLVDYNELPNSDTERFISTLFKEKADYTLWRRRYFDDVDLDSFLKASADYAKEHPFFEG